MSLNKMQTQDKIENQEKRENRETRRKGQKKAQFTKIEQSSSRYKKNLKSAEIFAIGSGNQSEKKSGLIPGEKSV